MTKILFYPSGDRELPSSHLRVWEVADELERLGFNVTTVDPTLPDPTKRAYLDLLEAGSIVYVQKISQRFHKPEYFEPYLNKFTIIYDVDDFHAGLDDDMMSMVDTVVAGSHYIADYASQFNSNVCLNCSITDTEIYSYADRSVKPIDEPIRIVWTESYANAYLEDLTLIERPMRKMYEKYNIEFTLQGLRQNSFIRNPKYHNLVVKFLHMFPYAKIQKFMPLDLFLVEGVGLIRNSDIGIIPFKPDRLGKAGQNIRSLMSAGLGVIGTPGNEHEHIITHGETGFLASSEEEWEQALEKLITDRELRLRMGRKASDHILSTYSRAQYMSKIIKILDLPKTS